jgi:hypothetical protein
METVSINITKYPKYYLPQFEVPEIEIDIHKLKSANIAIIHPGANGSKEGYLNKYVRMAENLIQNKICAVVRTPNKYLIGYPRTTTLEVVIKYALDNSIDICGTKNPNLYLMGQSIGAGAIDILSVKYQQIRKILLTSPCPIVEKGMPIHCLEKYKGQLYVVIGENDIVVPRNLALYFYHIALFTSKKKLEIIKDCDHDFKGEDNMKIFIRLATKFFK